ncbi:MAG: glycoside hydrolase N-terminal domain-containing protein [Candidatus Hydrogenedentes bacterium]|nr:glycoside hydrolase N-terminal domain-containing protein [Candidatus Hydrogenedentota bacterium]
MSLVSVVLCVVAASGGVNAGHDLVYSTPAMVWDEALPLGNGLLGALVWGDGQPLKISLDRTDLWDLRPVPEFHTPEYDYATMQQWEAAGRYEELKKLYEEPYHRPGPTKIPAGRIEIDLGAGAAFGASRLGLAEATAATEFSNRAKLSVWIHATEPVGFITAEHCASFLPRLVAPAFGGKAESAAEASIVMGELSELGYPAPVSTQGEDWQAYTQAGWGGFGFAVYLQWKPAGDGQWIAAWSVVSNRGEDDPLAAAKRNVEHGLADYDMLRAAHLAWWRAYWEKSWVAVPDAAIEKQWYLDTYKFGAASRLGAPPITLQGPWTADDGKLPPWKGDYHHDLNTELSYWPCYSGNRLEEGQNFVDWLWETRGACRAWTERFFKLPGLCVPMTADLNNDQIGGWRQYTHSATIGAWVAHHFYMHWEFSGDETFLRARAYPYLQECAVFLEAVTAKRDAKGLRTLPLSSSPEINDNKPDAWFLTWTNYDLALSRWLFGATAELAERVGHAAEAAKWRTVLAEVPELITGADGLLLVAQDYPLHESHRHFSHLMSIYPLGLIDPQQGPAEVATVGVSLAQLKTLGTKLWTGYSFAWEASLAARAGDGDRAAAALGIFAEAFVLRNSFHCNGDQSGKGYSNFTYRPFTLEGNFAAAAGLQEMLLQSHRGAIEVFPAVPAAWGDVAFHQLRARGGVLVSARRVNGVVEDLRLCSAAGGAAAVRDPAGGAVQTVVLEAGVWRSLVREP